MPRVNTTSVREELEHLRSEYDRLSSKGQVSAEVKMLIQGMFLLFEVLVSVFLEKTTRKNSKNSSLPPSQTEKDESATIAAGSKSKGREESLNRFSNSRTVEKIRESKVNDCGICGEDLRDVPCHGHERRTKIDIVFEKVAEHVDAEIKTCPSCNNEVKGEFPTDMSGPIQYGNGLKAWLINLVIAQMIALGRARKMVQTLLGVALAENTILKYVLQLHVALEPWEASAKVAMIQAKVMNCDETSLRVDKQNYWVHVYSAGEITLKFLHKKRGHEAVEDIGILPLYGGVVVHDCWASYFTYGNCTHGLCGSHLLRELTFVIESNGYAWAKNIKKLLKAACKRVSSRRSKRLTSREYAALQKCYRNIITRGKKKMPHLLERKAGKRGRLAKSDAHNLLERLEKYEAGVLLFAKISEVPFTNNRAERDLRMGKVKQKVSGCFRNPLFAHAYCRISSYLSTMANRGYNPLVAIQIALNGLAPIETSPAKSINFPWRGSSYELSAV